MAPLAGAWWLWLRARAEKRLEGLAAPGLRAKLTPGNPKLFNAQAALLLAGLALAGFAAARPQWGHSEQKVRTKSRNVVVALDVSRSMLAADVRPNRLERAKADIADLIDSLANDRCALVAFRRNGTLLCPLTTDHGFLRAALEGATPESAARGETDMGAAIRTALAALDPATDDHSAIILISDGGDLRGGALAAAKEAAKRNVPVFTVGLGDPRAASTIPDASGSGNQQYQGAAVSVKLEEEALAAIAKASGGRYVPLATAGTAETTLGAIYRRFLREVAAKEQMEEEEMRATERFGLFLVPGLLLMLAAGCMSRGRFAGRTVRAAAAGLAAMVWAGAAAGAGTNGVEGAAGAAATNAAEIAAAELAGAKGYEAPAEAQLSEREIWNKGYDYWAAGDMTNALATVRPLMLSRNYGARASEMAGAILSAQAKAKRAEEPEAAAKLAGEAAEAMQIALRANPQDARANRNFTRAADPVAELRETAHVAKVLKEAQGKQPDALLGEAVREARALMAAQSGVLTNAPGTALALSEALAARAAKLSDVWIPVKQGVIQAVTNQEQAAVIVGDIEAARDATKRSAELLEDMEPDAGATLGAAETAATRFWKMTIMPPGALDEGLTSQTNAFLDLPAYNNRAWQGEALDWTRAFRAKFPQWAQQYEQQAQADTNKPPFTKEQQAEIAKLAEEVEKLQAELAKSELPPKQQEALEKLARIKELMPKDNSGQGQNNQQQNPPPQNDQDKKDDNKDKNRNQDQNQDKNDQQKNDGQDEQEQKQEEKERNAENDPKNDKEVEDLLRKAQERSKEHEDEKKARMRRMPPSPNERDW